jgi:hypothetical protein
MVVVAARFEQEHAHIGVLGQTPGNDRSRGSRPANDKVVSRFQVRAELPLVCADTLDKAG